MNDSSLPMVYSKEELTSRFLDYSNVYFLPTVCFFGMVTSVFCLLGSYKKDASNVNLMNYIFINSFIDLLFLLTQFFSFIIRCGALCPHGYAYFSKLYEIYIFWFIGYSLVNMQVFFNTFVAYNRLKAFSGKSIHQTSNFYRFFFISATIAILLNTVETPLVSDVRAFSIYISNSNMTEVLYYAGYRDDLQNAALQIVLTICVAFKDPFMYSFFCFMNLLVVFRFRKYIKKKRTLVKNSRSHQEPYSIENNSNPSVGGHISKKEASESNFTKLTVFCCIIYLFGNFIDCFDLLAGLFNFQPFNFCDGCFGIVGNFFFYFSHSVHFFVYFTYNHKFRDQFVSLFR